MLKRALILAGTTLFGIAVLLSLMWLMSTPTLVVRADPDCEMVIADIQTNTTWTNDCYQVMTNTVTIHPNVALTIAPPISGTRVAFRDGAQLQVLGTLHARGAASRPITFTSINTFTPALCDWLGIIVEDDSGGDLIQYAVIEHACTGIKINDEDDVSILSNTFRYNGGGGSRDGAIGGDTDSSVIRNNRISSCTNGIVLGEAFSNEIVSNTIHHIDDYGLLLVKVDASPGGSFNTIRENEIYACGRDGLRLEYGYSNEVFGNAIHGVFSSAIPGSAIYLSEQNRASVQHNHVYGNGGGNGYQAAVYVTGANNTTNDYPDISFNVIYDEYDDAVEYANTNDSLAPSMGLNALCSIPAFELRNDDDVTINAPHNWWGTSVPISGEHYSGPVNITPWITLSLDGAADGVVTVRLRDQDGHTVPPRIERPTSLPAPNARRVEVSSNWGTISPTAVVVDDGGVATATLVPDASPAPRPVVLTATGFCGYVFTSELALPNLVITKTTPVTQIVAGEVLTYRISYANTGSAAVRDVRITDTLPSGASWHSDTAEVAGWTRLITTPKVVWYRPSLPAGTRGGFTLSLSPTICGWSLTNTVEIGTADIESSLDDNVSITGPIPVVCKGVDLVVIKDDDVGPTTSLNTFLVSEKQFAIDRMLQMTQERAPLAPTQHREFVYEGELITYTIAVVNVGISTATGVVLTETLPEYTNYVGIGWNQVDSRTFTQTVGELLPGDGRVYYFVVRVHDMLPAGVNNLVNHVCGWSEERDVYPDDNCNYEDTPVRPRSLRVWKSADVCIAPGDVFNYRITYQNTTTDTIFSNVLLTDTLDTYVNHVNGGEWNCSGEVCRRVIPTIPPSTTRAVLLPVQLSATFPYWVRTVITNVVEISGGNRFVLNTPVDISPDLSVVKNDNVGPLPQVQQLRWTSIGQRFFDLGLTGPRQVEQQREFVRPGELITYTILYLNGGVSPATGVVLTETLPQYTSYFGGGWTHTGGRQYVLQVGDVPPHQGDEVHFVVRVDDPFQIGIDRVINRVDIGSETPECDKSNNWSADDTPVRTDMNLYIANLNSGTLDVFNTTNFDYVTSIPAGPNPFGMATSGNLLFVANFEDDTYLSTLTSIDMVSQAKMGTVTAGRHPIHVAAYGEYIYVANHSGGEGITVVNTSREVVARVRPGQTGTYDFGFFGMTVDDRRGLIYATKRDFGGLGIWALTPPENGLVFTQVVDTGDHKPSSIVYNSNTDEVYVTFGLIDELWVFHPDDWELLERIHTRQQDPVDPGYGGHGLAALGRCIFVSNYRDQSVTAVINGICVESLEGNPTILPSGPHLVYLPLVGKRFARMPRVQTIGLGGSPKGMTAAGNLLFVTLPLEGQVVVINTETMQIVRRLTVLGEYPHTGILAGGNYINPAP